MTTKCLLWALVLSTQWLNGPGDVCAITAAVTNVWPTKLCFANRCFIKDNKHYLCSSWASCWLASFSLKYHVGLSSNQVTTVLTLHSWQSFDPTILWVKYHGHILLGHTRHTHIQTDTQINNLYEWMKAEREVTVYEIESKWVSDNWTKVPECMWPVCGQIEMASHSVWISWVYNRNVN